MSKGNFILRQITINSDSKHSSKTAIEMDMVVKMVEKSRTVNTLINTKVSVQAKTIKILHDN